MLDSKQLEEQRKFIGAESEEMVAKRFVLETGKKVEFFEEKTKLPIDLSISEEEIQLTINSLIKNDNTNLMEIKDYFKK